MEMRPQIYKDFKFSADLTIKLFKKSKYLKSDELVGHFTVSLLSIQAHASGNFHPQFFNVMDANGSKG